MARGEIRVDHAVTESEWNASDDVARMLEVCTSRRPVIWADGRPAGPPFVSDRRLRLFAVAACRQVWPLLVDEAMCKECRGTGDLLTCLDCRGTGRVNRSRRAVEVAERFADGEATAQEAHAAREAAWRGNISHGNQPWALAMSAYHHHADTAAQDCISIATNGRLMPPAILAALLRDIAGNPHRPVKLPTGPPMTCRRCDGDGWVCSDDGWGARDKCKVCDGRGTINLFGPCPWLSWRNGIIPATARSIYDRRAFEESGVLADMLSDVGCDDEEMLQHLRGYERCGPCEIDSKQGAIQVSGAIVNLGADWSFPKDANPRPAYLPQCKRCSGTGWRKRTVACVRGCWVYDMLTGRE